MWSSLFMGAYQIKETLPIKIPDITLTKVSLSNYLPKITLHEVDFNKIDFDPINSELVSAEQLQKQEQQIQTIPVIELGDEIYSKNAILVDLSNNYIISQKAGEERFYPASLTKIMTIILAIENISDLQQEVTLPQSMFEKLSSSGASVAGFSANEKVKVIDLLYGSNLPSGADAAEGLAICAAGSEETFVKLMNQKAKELKMDNTNFANVSGLHDENQYTTAQDLAKLLEYALKDKTFREVFTTKTYYTSPTQVHPGGLYFSNSIFKYMTAAGIDYGEIIGGKTGYTKEAGQCLATLAQKGDKQYIFISAGADGGLKTAQYNVIDAVNIYNKYLG